MSAGAREASLGAAAKLRRDLIANLAFFTRLPLPDAETAPPDFGRIAWAAPLAGALVGAIGGLALLLCEALSLPPALSAGFAVVALVLTTGALHEDGLADVADGFGGGATREAKLAILRDSRIGSYGAVAIGLSLILRVVAMAAMLRQGPGPGPYGPAFGFGALVLAGAAARAGALAPLALLPPARLDGAGASAGRLGEAAMRAAIYSVVGVAIATGALWLGVVRALFACVLAGAAAYGLAGLARRQIGGQTGDVAGASAQIVEIVVLAALLIGGRGA